ncbi:synaptic vesicle 2-related protein-like isoform X2 [Choristoneura fumiferana]|uniref:synaptic vesicle 2-related protein-like isoform X2 n=1 Tax=Choristoneura fumiferana TaxID=7141 RepID=UPI003D1581C3
MGGGDCLPSGHGCYNRLVLVACSVISNAVALDMFGFGVVLAAASCDLQLGITHIGVLASMPFAGLFFAFPWGYYADTRGRRRALLLSCAVGFIMAALGSFSPSWQVLLALKLIGCCFSTAAYSLTMTYLGECTGSKHRSEYLFVMNSVNLFSEAVTFILALLILPLTFNIPIPWLSITYRPWRLLTLLCAIPLGVGAVMMYFLYESPKFLANSGENDKALEVLRKIFKINGGKKENYQVKELENNQSESQSKLKFWESISEQTVPIFKPPLLWRTLQLFYLLVLCCSTNNVFVMWYPTIVNSFFTSFSKDVIEDQNFCDRVVDNIAAGASETGDLACDDTISYNTIYSGILYGSFFTIVNLLAAKLATWRRLVLIIILILSAVCSALINLIREPISSMVLFTLLQGTSVAIGAVASYFLDLYPTSYRGLATSLGMMTARFGSFTGVNIIGFAITSNCGLTFYCWSAFVFSGVAVALLLPSDSKGT